MNSPAGARLAVGRRPVQRTAGDLATAIEKTIRSLLDSHTVKAILRETGDRDRTKLVKTRLCEVGQSLGYRVAGSACNAEDPEWLYDMVWIKISDDDKILLHQAMILESEWKWSSIAGAAEIDLDFQKLVQARADVRVWIFAAPNEEIALKHIENCKLQIQSFDGTEGGDQYIFTILVWDGEKSIIERYEASSR